MADSADGNVHLWLILKRARPQGAAYCLRGTSCSTHEPIRSVTVRCVTDKIESKHCSKSGYAISEGARRAQLIRSAHEKSNNT